MWKRLLNNCFVSGTLLALSAVPVLAQRFTQSNLTTDTGIGGTKKGPGLINPWGMSRSSGSPW